MASKDRWISDGAGGRICGGDGVSPVTLVGLNPTSSESASGIRSPKYTLPVHVEAAEILRHVPAVSG
jgi:hypothetical protein